MTLNPNNPGYVRSLQILFFALLTGQILVFTILWFVVKPSTEPDIYQNPLDFAFIGIWLVKQTTAFFVARKLTETARAERNFGEKLNTYRRAQIFRFALMEGAVLIALFGFFFVTANYVLLALAATGIAIFLLFVPTRSKIVGELELDLKEETMLDETA